MDAEVRERVRSRANHRCEYCRIEERFFTQLFQIEHIVARSHGGSDEPKNLALACRLCNLHKGPNLSGIDPKTNELTRLFDPRDDSWDAHFHLELDGKIFGLTDIGRTTVRVLNMNAARRMELRKAIASLDASN